MQIQIVNEHDELVTVKDRSTVDYTKDIYRVAAVWITNLKGEILLAKRVATKDKDPNTWGPAAAGTVEEGETYASNIVREAKEEIGLTSISFKKGPKCFYSFPRKFFCQWFFATIDRPANSFTLQEDEVADIKWMDVDAFKTDLALHPQNYIPAMPQIVKELGL